MIPEQYRTSTVCAVLASITETGDWSRLSLAADALMDAGCEDAEAVLGEWKDSLHTRANLNRAFAAMRKAGLIAKQNWKCCQGCGWSSIGGLIEEKIDADPSAKDRIRGTVFYHSQDAESRDDGNSFFLAFGNAGTEKHGTVGMPTAEVGQEVCRILTNHGVKHSWDGSGGTRIEIAGFAS